MKQLIISNLRNKKSNTALFRSSANKIAHILAMEAATYVKQKKIIIETPLAKTTGLVPTQNIILIPILRAGLALLPAFLAHFENAKVGFIGLKRNEKTFEPIEYYRNLPKIGKDDLIMLLDPMIATGGSSMLAVQILKNLEVKEEQILGVFVVSAPEGLKKLKMTYPKVKTIIAVQDKKLNKNKYIIPGLGDFGDRFFGTN